MMQSRSTGGALYFVTFIDDCSTKVLAFALKSENQVLNMFKFFHSYVERGTRRKKKCVKADNDGEYKGLFEQYCSSYRIRLKKTISKTL